MARDDLTTEQDYYEQLTLRHQQRDQKKAELVTSVQTCLATQDSDRQRALEHTLMLQVLLFLLEERAR